MRPQISLAAVPFALLCSATACKPAASAPTTATPPATAAPMAAVQVQGGPAPLKETDVLAKMGDTPVLASEVMDKVRAQEIKALADYIMKVHQIRDTAVRTLVMDRVLSEEAKKAGAASVDDYLRAQAEKAKKPLDEARLKAVYAQVVPPGGPSLDEVRMELAQMVARQDIQEAMAVMIEKLMTDHKVTWQLPPPRLPRLPVSADDDPVLGKPDAKITIVEFSDFECPYCARAAEAVHAIVKKYDGKVRVVFRDFPLSMHKNARGAAMAAGCANAQGKFWAYHDLLFKNQQALDDKSLRTYARVAGADGETFDTCLKAGGNAAEVDKDMKDGEALGVDGTPSFFVNGRPLGGAPTVEDLSAAVEAALAEEG